MPLACVAEYGRILAVAAQRETLHLLRDAGIHVLIALAVVDTLVFATGGGFPAIHRPWMLVIPGLAASWVQLSAWMTMYNSHGNMGQVVLTHVTFFAAMALLPIPFSDVVPVSSYAAHLCFASLTAGVVLFVPRFTGEWENVAIAWNVWFVTAPAQLLLTLVLWWLAEFPLLVSVVPSEGSTATTLALRPPSALAEALRDPWSIPATLVQPHELVPKCHLGIMIFSAYFGTAFGLTYLVWFGIRVTRYAWPVALTLMLLSTAATVYACVALTANHVMIGGGAMVAFALLVDRVAKDNGAFSATWKWM